MEKKQIIIAHLYTCAIARLSSWRTEISGRLVRSGVQHFAKCLVLTIVFSLSACNINRSLLDPDDQALNGVMAPTTPAWVTAKYAAESGAETITVSWEDVDDSYELLRRYGAGDWMSIAKPSKPTYTDTTFTSVFDADNQRAFQYAVRGVRGEMVSGISVASNPTTAVVLNAKASILSRSDCVELSWDRHPEADNYRVYRTDKAPDAGGVPTLVTSVSAESGNSLSWFDVPETEGAVPLPSTIYYYLVTWVRDGKEFGKDGGFYRPGAYSGSDTDRYEPNDDRTVLSGDDSVFNPSQPPLIYQIGDGYGNTIADTDWYRHWTPVGQAFKVMVTLPSNTPFHDGELVFAFAGEGIPSVDQPIHLGTEGTNEFIFSRFGAIDGQVVFFSVKTKLSTKRNVIGTYSIKIVTSL